MCPPPGGLAVRYMWVLGLAGAISPLSRVSSEGEGHDRVEMLQSSSC